MLQPTIYRGHLICADDPRIQALIPHAKVYDEAGHTYTVVPHKLEEYRVLRNLQYDIQPPILSDYRWPIVNGFKPFDAQRFTAAMISVNSASFVANGLGTGKTRAALFAFDYLRREKVVHSLLVVAPLSTLRRTWVNEVLQTFSGMTYEVLHGEASARLKKLAKPADVYIVNHDGLAIVLPELAKRHDIDMVVYDETTAIKTKSTHKWKDANALFHLPHMRRVVGMSGLPTPTAPTDAYGQIKAVFPRALDGVSFSRFRDMTMRKITTFKYIPRAEANDIVMRYLQPSIRFTREQCFDLPPCQTVTYECKLSAEQKKLFNTLKQELHAQVQSGEITAINEADKINKLVQVILGCVYQTDGTVLHLDCAPRLAVLDEIVDAVKVGGKMIVFTPYKHSLTMLVDHLAQRGIGVAAVSGDTPTGQRNAIFQKFQDDPSDELTVIAAHPQCMAHGLTLTAASVIAWWGLPPSVEIYDQANARISRPGQKKNQYIAHIVATTLESQRYKQLEAHLDVAGLLLSMVKNQQLATVL